MGNDGPEDQELRDAVPLEIGLAIVRALQPTALNVLREAVARRVARYAGFAGNVSARRALEIAIQSGDRFGTKTALVDLVGQAAAIATMNLDPSVESPVGASSGPSRRGRRRATSGRPTPPPRLAPVPARPVVPTPDPPVLHRTVLGYGPPSAAPVRRTAHRRPRDEIQRWVADTRRDPPPILEVPALDPDSMETERWRDQIKFGELICPWPACPEPKLVLRAGEIRATHVAHRANARDHGAHTDWVLFTLAHLADVAGTPLTPVASNPPTMRVGDVVFVLLHDRLGLELARAAYVALGALPAGTTAVAVLRSSSLPRRSTALEVFGEEEPRWAFPTSRERTIAAVEALERFAHVVGAPERPTTTDDALDPDPRWGREWIGIGLERRPGRGQLDWRSVPRSPFVAVRLNQRTLQRVVRPGNVPPSSATPTLEPMAERGFLAEPVGFEEAGPILHCWGCGLKQAVSDGISTEEFDRVVEGLEDDDERGAALEVHDVHFCVFEACPRCGSGIDLG